MKFITAALCSGTALIAAPVAHHAFYVSEFTEAMRNMTPGTNINFPEAPLMIYAASAAAGVLLAGTALFFGIKIEMNASRIESRTKLA